MGISSLLLLWVGTPMTDQCADRLLLYTQWTLLRPGGNPGQSSIFSTLLHWERYYLIAGLLLAKRICHEYSLGRSRGATDLSPVCHTHMYVVIPAGLKSVTLQSEYFFFFYYLSLSVLSYFKNKAI